MKFEDLVDPSLAPRGKTEQQLVPKVEAKFKTEKIRARIGAPGRTRTDTGRILSPLGSRLGFQNFGILSVTQVQVLGILVELYAFMYAFSIWTSIPRSHK